LDGVGFVIAAIVIAGAAVVAAAVILLRRRSARSATGPEARHEPPHQPDAAPMTDLESALAQVTDRDGRPIRERIDAESVHVDPLRDPNDTGPLLRRALDSVAHHEPETSPDEPDARDA
jgi:hypothetical protein